MIEETIQLERLDKKAWQINLMAIAVILALLLTLMILQIFNSLGEQVLSSIEEGFSKYFVSLAIIVLLFCAYIITQQRQVARLTHALVLEKETSETLSQNLRTLSALFKVSAGINSKLEPKEVLDAMAQEILTCFDAGHTSVMLVDRESKSIKTHVSVGDRTDLVDHAVLPMGESIAGYVIDKGAPLLLNGEVGVDQYPGTPLKTRRISSSMCVPLKIAKQNIGVLNVNRLEDAKPFSEDDLSLVGVFANNAAGAIHNAMLYKRIKAFNEALEGKIKARTKELEAANQIKSNFLSNVSHEMQTPLNAVVGFAHVLLTGSHGELNLEQKKYAQHIARSGRRLSRIIQAMLDIASLTSGAFTPERTTFKFSDLLRSTLAAEQHRMDGSGLQLDIRISDDLKSNGIIADAKRIGQIVTELLSNAAKFSAPDGTITIDAAVKNHRQKSPDKGNAPPPKNAAGDPGQWDWLIVSVDDQGEGISENDREKIFDLFYQVQGGITDKASGIGVGLSISKILAGLLGGSIALDHTKTSKGSRFVLEVPVRCS